MKRCLTIAGGLAAAFVVCACAHEPTPLPPVRQVELPRFMGDWFVIAHVPSRVERNAYNAVETYALDAKGHVQTTFRFRNGSFDAPLKTMTPTGYVQPATNNAVWGMQFVWPIRAEYVIAYLASDYRTTIVGRSKRDYAWIMARSPTLADSEYEALLQRLEAMGYDRASVRRVPQRWPESRDDRRQPGGD
ncbi:lipocalin family protein [Lysobacter niabensis]|uniref:lipocalin family protein n=1 Tax=Agrilutibacter niabensis TaxID=380628 RepID=UPI003613FE6C